MQHVAVLSKLPELKKIKIAYIELYVLRFFEYRVKNLTPKESILI